MISSIKIGLVFLGFMAQAAIAAETKLGSETTEFIFLYVNKHTLQADLRTLPEFGKDSSQVLMNYQVAIGKQDGDKQVRGDNKTPEGIYLAQTHIDGKDLPVRYGPLAIPLDFPNPIDRFFKKTGSGIWLHGVEDNKRISEAKVTEGCVAFYNEDIKEISNFLNPKQALIVIDKQEYKYNHEQQKELQQATLQWIDAWKQRNLDTYSSFYHSDFSYRNMNQKEYSRYKGRVFASYKKMTVNMNDIRILTHPKYAIAIMNQEFDGDGRFISNGRKMLYWTKDTSGKWRIISEIFSDLPFEPTKIDMTKLVSKKRSSNSSAPDTTL